MPFFTPQVLHQKVLLCAPSNSACGRRQYSPDATYRPEHHEVVAHSPWALTAITSRPSHLWAWRARRTAGTAAPPAPPPGAAAQAPGGQPPPPVAAAEDPLAAARFLGRVAVGSGGARGAGGYLGLATGLATGVGNRAAPAPLRSCPGRLESPLKPQRPPSLPSSAAVGCDDHHTGPPIEIARSLSRSWSRPGSRARLTRRAGSAVAVHAGTIPVVTSQAPSPTPASSLAGGGSSVAGSSIARMEAVAEDVEAGAGGARLP